MTTNPEPRDLLATVDLLTLPRFEHVAQEHADGVWKVRTAEVPPLLRLFRDRVSPSGERNGTGTTTKDTRSVADLEAMMEYGKMVGAAAGWAHDAGAVPTRDPVKDLRVWYAATLTDNARNDDWYRTYLNGWVATIRDHLDPPEKYVPHIICPVCGGKEWGDQINGGDLWPILIRYRIDETTHRRTDEVARCRAGCETVWYGIEAIMELADEIAERSDTPA